MPWKPKTICSYPGCQTLTRARYCDEHKKQVTKEQNLKSSRLYTYQWRKASKQFLKEHPLCVHGIYGQAMGYCNCCSVTVNCLDR
jgi:5-methylcytosine-specific restriction protein A